MTEILQFLFILAVPIVLAGGGVVSLFAAGALFDALEHPEELSARIEAVFRQPPKPAKTPGDDHYYKPYWQSR